VRLVKLTPLKTARANRLAPILKITAGIFRGVRAEILSKGFGQERFRFWRNRSVGRHKIFGEFK
jgi:hypothetical protein